VPVKKPNIVTIVREGMLSRERSSRMFKNLRLKGNNREGE
jgi:hypothetical protein